MFHECFVTIFCLAYTQLRNALKTRENMVENFKNSSVACPFFFKHKTGSRKEKVSKLEAITSQNI